jgi:hypothetical protein
MFFASSRRNDCAFCAAETQFKMSSAKFNMRAESAPDFAMSLNVEDDAARRFAMK